MHHKVVKSVLGNSYVLGGGKDYGDGLCKGEE